MFSAFLAALIPGYELLLLIPAVMLLGVWRATQLLSVRTALVATTLLAAMYGCLARYFSGYVQYGPGYVSGWWWLPVFVIVPAVSIYIYVSENGADNSAY
jgi:hypothetical protein